ncbi:MAG: hypothetical protein U9Q69_03880 [Nanoarchaeota archaeon]|nr:hypothetical protein [Nanoarchaeota archaeon]
MNKKAISTMITVVGLISIAFIGTLSFAIATGNFIDLTESKAILNAEEKVICLQEVAINIQNACYEDEDNINFFVESNGIRNIEGFIVRLYSKDSNAKQDKDVQGLNPFMYSKFSIPWEGNAEKTNKIELLPKISLNGKEIICPNAKKSFGNSKETIKKCT